MAKGRPRKSGDRYKSGKLKAVRQKWDHGNDRVQARRALFDCQAIKGGKAADQVHDGIGQLWALDFLDGHGFDDTALRDTGRLFAELYWDRYSLTAPMVGQYERRSRGTGEPPPRSRRDIMFDRMDDSLRPGFIERAAVMTLCVDRWFSDRVADWAAPLIVTELVRRGRIRNQAEYDGIDAAIMLPLAEHRAMLDGLIRGLSLLIDSGLPARFERRAAA